MSRIKTRIKTARLGANRDPEVGWEFVLWAPSARTVSLTFQKGRHEIIPMEPLSDGYFHAHAGHLDPGSQYLYRLDDGRELPDPASRYQPEGVHGPSQTVDLNDFRWTDLDWKGRSLESSVFYEVHVGTFTHNGTFDALISHLPELVDLGVTTIELMPIAQFPGSRNWGYDGVYLFAPQNTYGGSAALQRLVNAAHRQRLSVALDVVYNHLGPEGNYLNAYGPYFTDRYRTPWGEALNFDGRGADDVRRFFIENALYWLEDYHFDVLRLDAVHGMFDFSARHFLAELKSSVADLSKRLGRMMHLIAESDLNDARILRLPEEGGYNLDAQWSDDFHHSLHALLTGEKLGYYSDFEGVAPLVSTLRDGWYYSGQHSRHRGRRHGNSPQGLPSSKFVVCNQNHDQIGNRAAGDRLSSLVNFEALKVAAGTTLLSPFVPLLFMGEEYGEMAPFQYFTSHGDPALVDAVRRGRRDEFKAFGWETNVPDPQDELTFRRSSLNHSLKQKEPHRTLWRFYQRLLRIRENYSLGSPWLRSIREVGDRAVLMRRENGSRELSMICNFAESPATLYVPELVGDYRLVIRSSDSEWLGPEPKAASEIAILADGQLRLSAHSFLLLERSITEAM